MTLAQRALVGLLAAVLLGYGVYWFFDNFEKVERERYVGLRGEAARNALLAAERFLARLDFEASSHDSPSALPGMPPAHGVLITTGDRLTLGPNGHDRILEWVRDGGHLIAKVRETPHSGGEEEPKDDLDADAASAPAAPTHGTSATMGPDPLLEAAALALIEKDVDREDTAARGPTDVWVPGSEESLMVTFDPRRSLGSTETLDLSLGSAFGAHLVSRPYGHGRLTLMTDTDLFDNDQIGEYDHAALLAQLVGLHGKPSAVWLVHGDDREGLAIWLWRHARPVVATLAVLILLWLIGRMQRFGPVLSMPPPDRRRITEHIQAAGEFYWRYAQSEVLLAEARAELNHRLENRYPELHQTETSGRSRRIAELTGLSVSSVVEALESPPNRDTDRYVAQIRSLQLAGKRL